jgi:hypothetical protein
LPVRRWGLRNTPASKEFSVRAKVLEEGGPKLSSEFMLATSLLISRDLFPFMALDGAFTVREIHMFAGYWTLLIIAIHLARAGWS